MANNTYHNQVINRFFIYASVSVPITNRARIKIKNSIINMSAKRK